MKELARHIEYLLLENDCVILPGVGGFISHNSPAYYSFEENTFFSPEYHIGFNPKLTLNDGLLTQSFMSLYSTSYRDAENMVNGLIDQLLDSLDKDGEVVLPNLGVLRYSIYGSYSFAPSSRILASPGLYGMDSINIKPWREIPVVAKRAEVETKKSKNLWLNTTTKWMGAAAMIAIIMLCVKFATPITSTDLRKEASAEVLPMDWLDDVLKVRDIIPEIVIDKKAIEIKPAMEQVAPTKSEEKKIYHIIIASMPSQEDALRSAKRLNSKGYPDARAIIIKGKNRVSLKSFATEQEAYNEVKEIRKEKAYKDAWVLKKR